MFKTYLSNILFGGVLLLLSTLVACGGSVPASPTVGTSNGSTPTSIQQQVDNTNTPTIDVTSGPATSSQPLVTPVVATPVTTPVSGPVIISTPTHVPGGSTNSQLVTLPDRTLAIASVSEQQGSQANTLAVGLVLKMNNTGNKAIANQAGFYQLVGAGGDIFGYQSSATASFFGSISVNSSRSGSIVFQVPTAAAQNLHLLFRSEIDAETVLVQLTIG